MLADRLLEGALCRQQRRAVARRHRPQQAVAFQRELGVDGDRARRVGQLQQAVGAHAGREGHLEVVGRGRQGALDQVVELDLAEGAARLLVGQDLLQADDLGRELADLLLRLVDADQPLAQVGDDLAGGLLGAVEPLGDDLAQRLLLLAQRLLDPLHGFGLLAQRQGELLLHALLGLAAAATLPHQHGDQDDDQRCDGGEEGDRQDIHCPTL